MQNSKTGMQDIEGIDLEHGKIWKVVMLSMEGILYFYKIYA